MLASENAPYEGEGHGLCGGDCEATSPSSGPSTSVPLLLSMWEIPFGKGPWQQGPASLRVTSFSRGSLRLIIGWCKDTEVWPPSSIWDNAEEIPSSRDLHRISWGYSCYCLNQFCLLTSLAFLTSIHACLPEALTNAASPGNSWSQSLSPEIPIMSSPPNLFFP